jgi:hypothetical protein
MEKAAKRCQFCEGKGVLRVNVLYQEHYPRTLLEDCPLCGGSGHLEPSVLDAGFGGRYVPTSRSLRGC